MKLTINNRNINVRRVTTGSVRQGDFLRTHTGSLVEASSQQFNNTVHYYHAVLRPIKSSSKRTQNRVKAVKAWGVYSTLSETYREICFEKHVAINKCCATRFFKAIPVLITPLKP